MVGPPYESVIRLAAYGAAHWDRLEAENPTLDLLGTPFRKLLSMLYYAYVADWYHEKMKDREPGMPELTYNDVDAELAAPIPRLADTGLDHDPGEFLGDYLALMGQ